MEIQELKPKDGLFYQVSIYLDRECRVQTYKWDGLGDSESLLKVNTEQMIRLKAEIESVIQSYKPQPVCDKVPYLTDVEIQTASEHLQQFNLNKDFLTNILENVFELTARDSRITINALKTILIKLNEPDFCNLCSIDISCTNEYKLLRLAQVVNNSDIIKERVLDICGIYQVNILKAIFKSLT